MRRLLALVSLATAGLAVMLASASAAVAGEWIQVSCVNPDGSAAPSEGWSAGFTGTPEAGASASTACAPGAPMTAALGALAGAPTASEYLKYQPPAGSTLVGGTVEAHLNADGYGKNAQSYAAAYEPALAEADLVTASAWAGSPPAASIRTCSTSPGRSPCRVAAAATSMCEPAA